MPFREIQNEQELKSTEDKYPANHQVKVYKKRVSSIRALRNFVRNISTEEKSEIYT